jgi:hypothetical protein
MDANATLAELRVLTTIMAAGEGTDAEWAADAERVAELFTALDEWIMRHGFLPMDWHRALIAALTPSRSAVA